MNRWLPLWGEQADVSEHPNDTHAVRSKDPPSVDYVPLTDVIFLDDVVAAGSISKGGVLSENLQEFLANHGLQ